MKDMNFSEMCIDILHFLTYGNVRMYHLIFSDIKDQMSNQRLFRSSSKKYY